MAPLPANNTKRYWYDYEVGGITHTLMARATDPTTFTAVDTAVGNLMTACNAFCNRRTITAARFSAAGSVVSNPFASSLVGVVYGTTAATVGQAAAAISVVGTAPTGRKFRVYVFGAFSDEAQTYRWYATESASVSSVLNAISPVDGVFVTIDGQNPILKNYLNVDSNEYWVKRVR